MEQTITLIVLVVIVILQYLKGLKSTYKIAYYEARLKNNGFDIDHVKNKSLWSMVLD